jgi:hypothetical protein
MSSCSQVFSAEALLRSDHEMAERIAELHDLRGRVREAEARARARWVRETSKKKAGVSSLANL